MDGCSSPNKIYFRMLWDAGFAAKNFSSFARRPSPNSMQSWRANKWALIWWPLRTLRSCRAASQLDVGGDSGARWVKQSDSLTEIVSFRSESGVETGFMNIPVFQVWHSICQDLAALPGFPATAGHLWKKEEKQEFMFCSRFSIKAGNKKNNMFKTGKTVQVVETNKHQKKMCIQKCSSKDVHPKTAKIRFFLGLGLWAMAAFDRYHAFRNFDGPPGERGQGCGENFVRLNGQMCFTIGFLQHLFVCFLKLNRFKSLKNSRKIVPKFFLRWQGFR